MQNIWTKLLLMERSPEVKSMKLEKQHLLNPWKLTLNFIVQVHKFMKFQQIEKIDLRIDVQFLNIIFLAKPKLCDKNDFWIVWSVKTE